MRHSKNQTIKRVGDKTWIDVAQIPYGVLDWMPTSGFQSMRKRCCPDESQPISERGLIPH